MRVHYETRIGFGSKNRSKRANYNLQVYLKSIRYDSKNPSASKVIQRRTTHPSPAKEKPNDKVTRKRQGYLSEEIRLNSRQFFLYTTKSVNICFSPQVYP